MYIDKLDDINKKYNNTNYSTIKMKPVDVKLRIYIDFDKESNDKDPKFKVDHLRILKCKNTFARSYVPNWSGEVSMIKKNRKYCSVNIYY